jgi:hypothetical protein
LLSCWASWLSAVRFAERLDIVVFSSELPLASLGCLCQPFGPTLSKPCSAVKKPLHGNALEEISPLDTGSCGNLGPSPSSADPRHHSSGCTAQDGVTGQGWQTARRPRWWRTLKKISPAPTPSRPNHSWKKAAEFFRGCCFNCLPRDHNRALCRDPSKCWKCKKSDHISSSCSKSLSTKPKCSVALPPSSRR